MVLRAGLALAAVGLGGFFLIQVGVPPIYVGAALLALVVIGAVVGPDSSSSGGGGGGGGSGGGSKAANAMNAANGFLDALGNNGGDDRRTEPSGPGSDPEDDDTTTGPGRDTGDDIDIEINNYIRNINFVQIEQNIEQIINDINISREETQFVNQFIAILMALNEGNYRREGDVIVISPGDVEVNIQAETLMNFLNILVSINYEELRQLIIELLDLRDADSWEIRIEQLIIIYREGDGGSGGGGGEAWAEDRWELMAQIINRSRLNDQLKNDLKNILVLNRGSGYNLPSSITPRKVYAVRKRFAIPPKDAVKPITNDFITFLQNQNINRINDSNLSVIINQFIVNEIDISKQTVPNDINPRDVNTDIMGQEGKDIETILSDAKDEVQVAEEIKELNQNIVRDIENIEKIYEKNQKLFENIDQIKFTNFKEVSPQEMYSTIKKLDQYTTLDLATEQGAVTVANSVHEMHKQLNDLMSSLRKLDEDTSKLIDEERDVVSHAEDLEAHVEKLEKLADTMARFNGVDSADKLGNPGNM